MYTSVILTNMLYTSFGCALIRFTDQQISIRLTFIPTTRVRAIGGNRLRSTIIIITSRIKYFFLLRNKYYNIYFVQSARDCTTSQLDQCTHFFLSVYRTLHVHRTQRGFFKSSCIILLMYPVSTLRRQVIYIGVI